MGDDCSVPFSCSVASDSVWPHGMQHARHSCPSLTPGVVMYSDSCTLSCWCHPTISSFVIAFFSCLQSFPASGSSPISQFFASNGQNTGVWASASVLSVNFESGLISFRIDWLDLPVVQETLNESSSTPQLKSINSLAPSFLYSPNLTSIHDYWKNHSLD